MRRFFACHKILITFSFLILSLISVQAQVKVDSLRKRLLTAEGIVKIELQYTLAKQLLTINPDEAETLIKSALQASEEAGYAEGKVMSWLTQAALYNYRSDLVNSENLLHQAIQLAQEIGFEKGLAQAELTMGTRFLRKREFSMALEHFMKGIEAARKTANPSLQVSNLINIGVVYQLQTQYDEAEKYLQEALMLSKENGLTLRLGQINGNLGIIEYKRQNFGLSVKYHQAGLDVFQTLNDKSQSAISLFNLGLAYIELGQTQKALEYYDASIALRKEVKDRLGISVVLRYKGKLLEEEGKRSEALILLKESADIAREFKDHFHMRDTYQLIYETYEREKDTNNAYAYYKRYVSAKDSLNASVNKNKITELTAQFEVDGLEKQNDIILKENEIKDLRITQRNQTIIAISFISILIIILLIWNRGKLKDLLTITEKDKRIALQEMKIRVRDFDSEKELLIKYANQLLSKNEALEEKKTELEEKIELDQDDRTEIDKLVEKMRGAVHNDKDWAAFTLYFEAVFPGFFNLIKGEKNIELTLSEQRLVSLLKINLSNKEIGGLLNISRDSVVRAKYRLKQKFGFKESKEMESFLAKFS